MTIEQRKDEGRHWRYVERNDLRPVMNDTKWREAIGALEAIPSFPVQFRARNVRDPIDAIPHWDSSFPWHVPRYWAIEWLDIDPILPDHLIKNANFPVHDLIEYIEAAVQKRSTFHSPMKDDSSASGDISAG